MSDIDHSAKVVHNRLQNRSDKASADEVRELVKENFPTEELAKKAHSHIANDLEVSSMEVTEDWFRTALPMDYDDPDIHDMIDDFTAGVYNEAT